jgi:hypothetical protein
MYWMIHYLKCCEIASNLVHKLNVTQPNLKNFYVDVYTCEFVCVCVCVCLSLYVYNYYY